MTVSSLPMPHARPGGDTSAPLRTAIRRFSAWVFDPLFSIYVFLLVILPSGSLFGVNVKIICFVLLSPLALERFLQERRTTLVQICLLFAVPIGLLSWVLLSQCYSGDLALSLSQSKEIFNTFVSCWLASVFVGIREDARITFLRMILFAEAVASAIKIGLLAYAFYRGIPISLMVDSINVFFGVQLMGMDFDSALGRIQFIADGLIPICLYMLLRYRVQLRIKQVSALLFFLLLAVSLVFTFSRYLWAFAAVVFCLGIFFGKKDRFHFWLLLFLGIVLAANFASLATLYDFRFSAAIAGGSDSVRTQQIPALARFFLDAPLFGHGFGSYTREVIRSVELPYGYEVQLYALAGQEGIAGLVLMFCLTAYYFRSLLLWNRASYGRKLSLLIILITWISAGLFNPMLFNSAAAMSYAAINVLSEVAEPGGGNRELFPEP